MWIELARPCLHRICFRGTLCYPAFPVIRQWLSLKETWLYIYFLLNANDRSSDRDRCQAWHLYNCFDMSRLRIYLEFQVNILVCIILCVCRKPATCKATSKSDFISAYTKFVIHKRRYLNWLECITEVFWIFYYGFQGIYGMYHSCTHSNSISFRVKL